MEFRECLDGSFDVLGRQADFRRQVCHVRIFPELAEKTIENAHVALHRWLVSGARL
jgi:hypothetical protein